MAIARRGLKVKVKVMGEANAIGPTLIQGSFSSYTFKQQIWANNNKWLLHPPFKMRLSWRIRSPQLIRSFLPPPKLSTRIVTTVGSAVFAVFTVVSNSLTARHL